jgi:hypothetical protein
MPATQWRWPMPDRALPPLTDEESCFDTDGMANEAFRHGVSAWTCFDKALRMLACARYTLNGRKLPKSWFTSGRVAALRARGMIFAMVARHRPDSGCRWLAEPFLEFT